MHVSLLFVSTWGLYCDGMGAGQSTYMKLCASGLVSPAGTLYHVLGLHFGIFGLPWQGPWGIEGSWEGPLDHPRAPSFLLISVLFWDAFGLSLVSFLDHFGIVLASF